MVGMFGPERDEVTVEWSKLQNEELNDLYFSPNIIRVKFEKNEMDGACSTYGREEKCVQGFWWEIPWERDHLEDPGVDDKIILRWIFRLRGWRHGLD
jgi:hypothetical protein